MTTATDTVYGIANKLSRNTLPLAELPWSIAHQVMRDSDVARVADVVAVRLSIPGYWAVVGTVKNSEDSSEIYELRYLHFLDGMDAYTISRKKKLSTPQHLMAHIGTSVAPI